MSEPKKNGQGLFENNNPIQSQGTDKVTKGKFSQINESANKSQGGTKNNNQKKNK